MRGIRRSVVTSIAVITAGCASQPLPTSFAPGFLLGLVHGIMVPLSFIGSIFRDSIRIYAFPNTGVMYDLGFVLGFASWPALIAFGGAVFLDEVQRLQRVVGIAQVEIYQLHRKVRRLRRRLRERG